VAGRLPPGAVPPLQAEVEELAAGALSSLDRLQAFALATGPADAAMRCRVQRSKRGLTARCQVRPAAGCHPLATLRLC
jgi:hypothetical protein